MEEQTLRLAESATSDTATARLGIFAAGPERADEGGGPTPGRLGGEQRVEGSQLVPSRGTDLQPVEQRQDSGDQDDLVLGEAARYLDLAQSNEADGNVSAAGAPFLEDKHVPVIAFAQ